MQRLMFLVTEGGSAQVEAALVGASDVLRRTAARVGAALRVAVQVSDDPFTSGAGPRTIVPARGMVELSMPAIGDEHIEACGEIAAALESQPGPSATNVVAGAVRELLPAACDDLIVVLAASRLPTLSPVQSQRYWLGVHAQLALSLLDEDDRRRMGYQQLHVDAAVTALASDRAGLAPGAFDGVLQVGLATLEDLPHVRRPDFAERIAADEVNFADQAAEMCGGLLRTTYTQEVLS